MGTTRGVRQAHRERGNVPNGTSYEAGEGARGGSAVRKRNCQVTGKSGGDSVGGSEARPLDEGTTEMSDAIGAVAKASGAITKG